jgi:hypothetical protein
MLVGLVLVALAGSAQALTLDDPANYHLKNTWSGASLGIPSHLGGLLYSEDGSMLYVVGDSEGSTSALYAVPVTRDPSTLEVTALGPAAAVTIVFAGSKAGLDAGWDRGPAGTLFYTYWNANFLGERPGGLAGPETLFDMAAVSLPSSIAGLAFSPHFDDPGTGFGQMQVSTWYGADLWDVALLPSGGGIFTPIAVSKFVTLPHQGTGAIQYVPSGPLAGDVMYVNWDYGEVRVLTIDDATGLAIDAGTMLPTHGTTNPLDVRFASGLGVGPWGLEFDPLTNDFFLGTWSGTPGDSILQIGGAGFPPPTTTTSPVSTTTTTTLAGLEACGNCRDDDGNGLVDFEDPACCGGVAPVPLRLERALVAPRKRGPGTALRLTSRTAPLGIGRPPGRHDVFLQVRPIAGGEAYCAHLPADRVKATRSALRFKDRRERIASAGGISQATLSVKKDRSLGITARGSRTSCRTPSGPARVVWAIRAPGAVAARCSGLTAALRATRQGAVRYP